MPGRSPARQGRGSAGQDRGPASCEAAINATISSLGKLTTLVNVAATRTPDGTLETLSFDPGGSLKLQSAVRREPSTGENVMVRFRSLFASAFLPSLLLTLGAGIDAARAQPGEPYPVKQIRMIVPAGAGADMTVMHAFLASILKNLFPEIQFS